MHETHKKTTLRKDTQSHGKYRHLTARFEYIQYEYGDLLYFRTYST